jgi:hypothetical protein
MDTIVAETGYNIFRMDIKVVEMGKNESGRKVIGSSG